MGRIGRLPKSNSRISDRCSYCSVPFFREPDNPYDKRAIVIKNASGMKIGYVPKEDNAELAR